MARKRRARLYNPGIIERNLRAASAAADEAERALNAGNCGEAADALAHAYEARGIAEGYARALREQRGRVGTPPAVWDKRTAKMPRLRVKIRRACEVKL